LRLFGPYKEVVSVTYAPDKPPLTASAVFWALPFKSLGWALLVLLSLGIIVLISLKRYKRKIIQQYANGTKHY
jgi:hypothetical protein